MRKLLIFITFITSIFSIVACSSTPPKEESKKTISDYLPGLYKVNIQQGNIITQKMVDQLRPGMDKRQVKFLLGTPLLTDSFHKQRWDYFYNLKVAGKQKKQEQLTVFFKNEKLINIKGNFKPSNEFKPMTIDTKVVDVPKRDKKEPSIIERILHFIGIEYEEEV